LDEYDSVWPQTTLRRLGLRPGESTSKLEAAFNNGLKNLRKKLEEQNNYHLDEWLDIEFIAAHTKTVGKLVYYPFIILALIIFARSKIFAYWDIPIGLAIIYLSAAALTLGSALYLRRVAEHARQNIIKKISSMKIALTCQPDTPARRAMENQIDLVLVQIRGINEGAFQPLTNEPAFQALLIPFGSFGGVMLLENFVLNGF
jgi:hypothetical protein